MAFNADLRSLHIFSPSFIGNSNPLRFREFRVFWRWRPKRRRGISLRCELNPIADLLRNVLAPNSIEILAPAIGLVSGLGAFASRFGLAGASEGADVGEWILFASPTPFNRFVLLRCPSVSFEGGELLEGVNERLVREDKHYVRINSGRVVAKLGSGALEEKLEYQRVCVSADDGGVISLDWPANLDLAEERGLDATLLIVPGSVQGSREPHIRSFVCEAMRRGCFPVVMNPRGCAGSPLTTARLFTAADSDDIDTAIQFINKARPWTALMGVGWEYGANMLTKYLSEVGESTPLTAATCIDNPFDLEEAARSSPHHMAVDQKLTGGLVDILSSNKELFQGRDKGFDVDKALSAKSLRDFEKAISMVSYGFEDVEDFYSVSSTRNLIGNVKIPVLFIQNDDGSAPRFSIPRSSIAENPFTSLLLCSCFPCSSTYVSRSAVTWCQQLTLEWLTAVELGLLKGRHPLHEDLDITINPSTGLAFTEGKQSNNSTKIIRLANLTPLSSSRGYAKNSINTTLEESDAPAGLVLRSRRDLPSKYEAEGRGFQNVENGPLSADAELTKPEEDNPITETSEVLQTSQVVMNMLDVAMPGTLTEEKKKKVLAAVNQGETLVNALQDAVPDDAREKLTNAVSRIVQSQGTQLKVKELLRGSRISTAPGMKSKVEDKGGETSNAEGLSKENGSSGQPVVQTLPGGVEVEHLQPESSEKSANIVQSQSTSEENDNSTPPRKETSDSRNNENHDDALKEKSISNSGNVESGSDTASKPNSSSPVEKGSSAEEAKLEEYKDPAGKTDSSDVKQDHSSITEENPSPEQGKTSTPDAVGENASPTGNSSEDQSIDKEDSDNQKRENRSANPILGQLKSNSDSNPPSFSVTQALDALAGMDDSTQVAVNNVFGVIEGMLSQLEEGSNNENGVKNQKNSSGTALASDNASSDQKLNQSEATAGNVDSQKHGSNGFTEKHSTLNLASPHEVKEANVEKDQLSASNLLCDNSNQIKKADDSPPYISSNSYVTSFDNNHMQNNLFSEIPTESLDSDATTALLLEYFPEEGQWKLLEQSGSVTPDDDDEVYARSPRKVDGDGDVIEPIYSTLDTETQQDPVEDFDNNALQELKEFVKEIILDRLWVEVGRKLGSTPTEEVDPNLARDLELVSNAVSMSVRQDVKYALGSDVKCEDINELSEKVGTLNGDHVIRAISSAVQETTYLRRVLPLGVIVGSGLAALRKNFDVATGDDNDDEDGRALNFDETINLGDNYSSKVEGYEAHQMASQNTLQNERLDGSRSEEGETTVPNYNRNATVMVGAVTAAIGASALLVQNQDLKELQQTNEALISSSKSSSIIFDSQKEPDKVEETPQNIVASLAEKAMSVASPVVPTNEDGEVDQERLVAMLADLGQKGGILRLVGKVALLWGGIRGAMSLTDRLISFLRIAERPLIHRALGFAGMVLVIWSPVAVPLLPTLVQSWSSKNPSRIAELACIVGLYTAVIILVMLWGRRIRGYENPPEQYGLDLTSLRKIPNCMMGLIGGIVLVSSIQAVNALLGCVSFSWPYATVSLTAMAWVKVCGETLIIVCQGLVTAFGVALVEELLFRSWLPEEIAADLGYHQGIIISGLVFSLLQRSPFAIPGLWLLSLSLSGIRQRSEGSLSIVIGLRAGILASSFILQRGSFLTYKPSFPLWLTGTHPFEPFSGLTGFAFSLILALFLYPRQPMEAKKMKTHTHD